MAKKRANGEGNIRKRTDGTQGVGQAVDPHFSRTVFNIFAAKSTENKSFRCFFEPLAGFEPPTSSLPNIYHLFFLLPLFVHYSSEVLVSLVLRGLFTAPCCRLLCLVCCGFW